MNKLPEWAPRIKRSDIYRLYECESRGMIDEALLDEVFYGLYARALSIIEVTHVHSTGRINCPECKNVLKRDAIHGKKSDLITCKCGWQIIWEDYFKTYHKKNLVGGAALPFVKDAVKTFASCRTNGEKMRWIDNLIHIFHCDLELGDFRPAAINFIGGNAKQVIELIYTLAYGKDSPEERLIQAKVWKERLSNSYQKDKAPV